MSAMDLKRTPHQTRAEAYPLLPSSLLRLLSSPPSSPSLVLVLKGKIFEVASTGGLLFSH